MTGEIITTSLFIGIELFEIIEKEKIFEPDVKLGIQNKIYITPETINVSDLQRISKEILYESYLMILNLNHLKSNLIILIIMK